MREVALSCVGFQIRTLPGRERRNADDRPARIPAMHDSTSSPFALTSIRIARWAVKASILWLLAGSAAIAAEQMEFTRLIAHWSGYADPGYLPFVDDVKPDIAQVGFYGAHFWSLADTEFGGGYPA